jgi:serine/threonine protein kinase
MTTSSSYASLHDRADLCQTFIGTILYMSPERIMGESYSFGYLLNDIIFNYKPYSLNDSIFCWCIALNKYRCDVWAMGLSLVTCALGRYAIPHTGHYELIVKIKDCDFLSRT